MDNVIADRLRNLFDGDPRITEKKMFGGITFLMNGHMLVAAKKDGQLMVHVSKADNEEALGRPGATQMAHGGRTMRGFIWVDADETEDDEVLAEWIALAERYVRTQQPK
ncbi:MAG TPA: TfoX/Sxy family protein [Devosia sp.]|nr:TfoX/Sxy family protein [Devosia sp.]